MTTQAPLCRLCGSQAVSPWLLLKGSPWSIERLDTAPDVPERTVEFQVWVCGSCSFVQASRVLPDDYYESYVMATSHSRQMQEFQREQASAFVTRYGLRGKRVIEVGCGDGNYLKHLAEAGAEAAGIEPSEVFRSLALMNGWQVHAGYVGRGKPIPGSPYEAFVTRQVLEHVEDPNEFLGGIREHLCPCGVGLIEVPSLEQCLEHKRFYDFFPDHLNYFSAATLRYAAERNGFEVLDCTRGMGGEYNVLTVRRREPPGSAALCATLDTLCAELRAFVTEHSANGVALWGAGGKGNALLGAARPSCIAYVIDSDPRKHGRYTPVLHLPIVPPAYLNVHPVGAIVVTALAYREEILNQLRSMEYGGVVAMLGETITLIKH